MEKFGLLLKTEREQKNLSKYQLGVNLGLNPQSIRFIESSERFAGPELRDRLIAYFEADRGKWLRVWATEHLNRAGIKVQSIEIDSS